MRVWYRTQARISQLFSTHASPEALTVYSSPVTGLPLEIVEMTITHLIYDTPSLLACSLTCYSWYIATVPYLHHTLITLNCRFSFDPKHQWPDPLQNAGRLGLLPFVKRLQVRRMNRDYEGFHPKRFNHHTLRHFSTLSNVQDLEIEDLDIPNFMPRVREYFGQFSLTLRSLALSRPKGSCRQIVFFIGQFRYLEDLKLLDDVLDHFESESTEDPALIPLFAPPLRGRLKVTCSKRVRLLRDMIHLFGGIRFHYMDLYDVGGMGLLLDACGHVGNTAYLSDRSSW